MSVPTVQRLVSTIVIRFHTRHISFTFCSSEFSRMNCIHGRNVNVAVICVIIVEIAQSNSIWCADCQARSGQVSTLEHSCALSAPVFIVT